MEEVLIGIIASIPGILVAVAVPLAIERYRRPVLEIGLGDDADRDVPPRWRIVHVRVINRPIGGWPGRLLLRNVATGCTATVTLRGTTESPPPFNGKWSAKPQPIMYLTPSGSPSAFFNPEMVPDVISLDVSPGDAGQAVAIAIKHEGDDSAYAFAPDIYVDPVNLRAPHLRLGDERYDVTVEAEAGGIRASANFVLSNTRSTHSGLILSAQVR